jgi:hypothetical protein
MIIGIELNRTKTEEGKTFYRIAPYIHNVDKMKVGVVAFLIFAATFLFTWSTLVNAEPIDNSHIKPWTSYNGR